MKRTLLPRSHAGAAVPPGYRALPVLADGTRLVALAAHVEELSEILSRCTLYEWASRCPSARALAGRGIAFSAPLPITHTRVVVRHNRHGGALAAFTGDRFLPPTSAPYELMTAVRLEAAGIPTPVVVAFATYRAGLFRRADVLTREVVGGRDLAAILTGSEQSVRTAALEQTARLIISLSRAGARHYDLNIKNVLVREDRQPLEAMILDVDRIRFETDLQRVGEANLARFTRSALKWRRLYGARITEADIRALAGAVRAELSVRRTHV